MYDFLIVGAGLSGITAARMLTERNYKCLVVEKNDHIGGTCHTEVKDGVMVHVHGAHSFHTDNKYVWDFMNRYGTFVYFANRHKAIIGERVYNFPINLMTLYDLYKISTPKEAREYFANIRGVYTGHRPPRNFEEVALSTIGEKLYRMFFYGFTKKHWGVEPCELPAHVFTRLPVRYSFDDLYFKDDYQGVPVEGYTKVLENMLGEIPIVYGEDYLKSVEYWDKKAKHTIYTGMVDEFFRYKYGRLNYRSIHFEHQTQLMDDYQGGYVINYPSLDVPWTRIIEHKHMLPEKYRIKNVTVYSKMFPADYSEDNSYVPYYPVRTLGDLTLYEKYRSLIDEAKYTFIGRLAQYRYYNMDECVIAVLREIEALVNGRFVNSN